MKFRNTPNKDIKLYFCHNFKLEIIQSSKCIISLNAEPKSNPDSPTKLQAWYRDLNLKSKMFFLYNITYNIEEQIHDQWLQWVQEHHIPDVLKNTPFVGAKLIKVLMDEDMGGVTYSIQYQAENRAMLGIFLYESKFNIFGDMLKMFPNQFVSFSTELEVINEYSKI